MELVADGLSAFVTVNWPNGLDNAGGGSGNEAERVDAGDVAEIERGHLRVFRVGGDEDIRPRQVQLVQSLLERVHHCFQSARQ